MKKLVFAVVGLAMSAAAVAGPAPDSKRLALAKDYIADEQWLRAIAELQVVAADVADPNRDEALFWLAHSQYQAGDHAEAIQTIARLEQLFPRSRWVRPARSLRIELAQRLRRDDVLWVLATPPPPPAAPPAGAVPAGVAPRAALPPLPPAPSGPRTPPPPRRPPAAAPPAAIASPAPPTPAVVPTSPAIISPTPMWGLRPGAFPPAASFDNLLPAAPYAPDTDLRIQALVSLMDTHSERVIPLLRDIALDNKNPTEARRAVFVLAQSPMPEARRTVVDAAKRGPEMVRIAAIRELGRFQEPMSTTTLLGIARGEADSTVRDTAILTLGRTAAHPQLRLLYTQLPPASRFAVLSALSTAKDDDELIRIASTERDVRLRMRARQQLRLLATPKALKFLAENP